MHCCGRDSEELENGELKLFCFPLNTLDAVSPMGVGEELSGFDHHKYKYAGSFCNIC